MPSARKDTTPVAFEHPQVEFRNAEGHIELSCDDCTVGDGTSKISMSPPKTSTEVWGA